MTDKESYLKSKHIYDQWRKDNPHRQAWHQFNHNRRKNNKTEYSFKEYLKLRKNRKSLNRNGNLTSSFTKNLP